MKLVRNWLNKEYNNELCRTLSNNGNKLIYKSTHIFFVNILKILRITGATKVFLKNSLKLVSKKVDCFGNGWYYKYHKTVNIVEK